MVGANFNLYTLSRGERKTLTDTLVKLTGLSANGADTFTGSGVITEASKTDGTIKVMTARHNVSIFNNTTSANPNWSTELFKDRVKIHTNGGTQIAIDDVELLGTGKTGLDLAVLTATDLAVAKSIRGLSPLQNFANLGHCKNAPAITLEDLQKYETGSRPVFVQAGFGAASQNGQTSSRATAQYRQVSFIGSGVAFLDKTHEGYKDVFILPASPDSTSAPGDSGGPLYMILGDKVAVLGVNLGANYYKNKTDNSSDSDSENNAITSILGQIPVVAYY